MVTGVRRKKTASRELAIILFFKLSNHHPIGTLHYLVHLFNIITIIHL